MDVREQIYVNTTKPKPSLVKPIKNRKGCSKPKGGFWTSPSYGNISDFERYEDGALIKSNSKAWKLIPKKDCNVKFILKEDDLQKLPKISYNTCSPINYIDFETFFSRGYDGLYISGDVAHLKSFSNDCNLRGWDFDSIIWSNLNWVDTIIPMDEISKRR